MADEMRAELISLNRVMRGGTSEYANTNFWLRNFRSRGAAEIPFGPFRPSVSNYDESQDSREVFGEQKSRSCRGMFDRDAKACGSKFPRAVGVQ